MQLRNQVEWVLHCCAILSALPADRYLSTKVLAEFHGVPKEYLSKAMQSLSQAGIVESTLGPSGGYRLARTPSEITFLDIIEAVEGRGPSFICTEIRKNNPCRSAEHCDLKPCPIAQVMWQADREWRKSLRGVSLSELGEKLVADIPEELMRKSFEWLSTRR